MPVPKGKRTSEVINAEINEKVSERDKVVALYKVALVALTEEYDKAVAREAAQKKVQSMDAVEKSELASILRDEGVK